MMARITVCVWLGVLSITLAFAQRSDLTFAKAAAAQQQHGETLLAKPGVMAVGVGSVDNGLGVHVFVTDAGMAPIPATLDGVPVKVFVTGEFSLFDAPLSHDGLFPKPVPMGVQTTDGIVNSDGFIAIGTLGFKACDAEDPSIVGYVSNNHVAATGGPSLCVNMAPIGTPEYQFRPDPRGSRIGDLRRFVPISLTADNRVDAAFVRSDDSSVSDRVLEIGWPSRTPGDPSRLIGQLVQKSGGATGYSKGRISTVNAIVNVDLGSGCGQARFVDQIIIQPVDPPAAFLAHGDSGSALWDMDNNLLGLLFAGSDRGGYGVANRISDVLSQLNLRLDCPLPNASTAIFPHFADGLGGDLTSSLILVNPSPSDAVYGDGALLDPQGVPLNIGLNAERAEGRFSFFINPLGLSVFNTTDLLSGLEVGSIQIGSNRRLDGSVLFSQRGAGAAGVGSINPAAAFIAPTFRNVRDGVNSGLAMTNGNSTAVTINLTLNDAEGRPIPNGSRTLTLPPNGQLADYIDHLFPDADASSIAGTIQAISSAPIAAVTLMSTNYLTTLPVVPEGGAGNEAIFPHFAVGARGIFSSSLILFNPSSQNAISGSARLLDAQGNPLRVELDGIPVNGEVTFDLPPRGLRVFKTTGQPEDFQVGSVRVSASGPVSGSVLFSQSGLGIAGVGNSLRATGFIAPVFRDVDVNGKNTGIAFTNTQETPVTVDLALRDAQGNAVTGGTATRTLPPRGQLALFVNDLFPAAATSNFSGTLSATSSAAIAAVVVSVTNSSLTTLPVTIQNPAP